mmetsp:Transcript_23307/g.34891  ORF Transcript_23307/g.34891 Transcript_23307/m.34891 type:complete len:1072 (-) Transcript_23307:278-3493(-)
MRFVSLVVLLDRIEKSSLLSKSKGLRRAVACTAFIVSSAKSKNVKSNYFYRVATSKGQAFQCSRLCHLVSRALAQDTSKDAKLKKSKLMLLGYLTLAASPPAAMMKELKSSGRQKYLQTIAKAYIDDKGVIQSLGIALEKEQTKKASIASSILQVALRTSLALSRTLKSPKPVASLIKHVLSVPIVLYKPSTVISSIVEKQSTFMQILNGLGYMIDVSNGPFRLSLLSIGGIAAPPIAYLFGNLLSAWALVSNKLGWVCEQDVALPMIRAVKYISTLATQKSVKHLMESISRGSNSIGAGLSKQLDIAFRPGANNLIQLPFQVMLKEHKEAVRTYTYRPSDSEAVYKDWKLGKASVSFTLQINPLFLEQSCEMYSSLCTYWPRRQNTIMCILSFTTPALTVLFAHLQYLITLLQPAPAAPGNKDNSEEKTSSIKTKHDRKMYKLVNQKPLDDKRENRKHKDENGKLTKKKSFFSMMSSGIVSAVRKLAGSVYSQDPITAQWINVLQPLVDAKSQNDPRMRQHVQIREMWKLFTACYARAIAALESDEMNNMKTPILIGIGMDRLVRICSSIVFDFYSTYDPKSLQFSAQYQYVADYSMALLTQLRQRFVREKFCSEAAWALESKEKQKQLLGQWNRWVEGKLSTVQVEQLTGVVRRLPYLLTFEERAKAFRYTNHAQLKRAAVVQSRIPTVNIRRSHLVIDGWEAIKAMGPSLRNKIAIRFFDKNGRMEAGLDMGGPFKEFLESLCHEVFRLEYGLFNLTHNQCYYPNPSCMVAYPDWQDQMEFVGKVLGKALLEGHLIEVRFASFFLNHLLGRPPHLDDLKTVDKELYKNIMFVKTYEGDMEDLCLSFSVNNRIFGKTQVVNLIPGGDNIDVTRENRVQYVTAMADYHLARKIQPMTQAFRRGLFSVIRRDWLQLFTHHELKILLSGSESADIDVDDLRRYSQVDPMGSFPNPQLLMWFWRAVRDMDSKQKRLLLKFVTACSHPPLLGFRHLSPPFTIRFVPLQEPPRSQDRKTKRGFLSRIFGGNPKAGQLPTSATCFNMLKLPMYRSQKALATKLIMAIESKAGFDLQ